MNNLANEIIFVTSNKGKQASAQGYFDKKEVEIKCYDHDYDEPDVNDIEYIAKVKVLQAYSVIKKPCISVDAGFYIPSYPGNPNFPGAFPKRELIDKIGIDGLLENMKGEKNRYCYFKDCLAYYDGNEIFCFHGISEGILSLVKKEKDNEKKWSDLWYVFIPKNHDKTLSEMSDYERDNRKDGHTSALNQFCDWYKERNKVKKKMFR